jgi:hypothetical protein
MAEKIPPTTLVSMVRVETGMPFYPESGDNQQWLRDHPEEHDSTKIHVFGAHVETITPAEYLERTSDS